MPRDYAKTHKRKKSSPKSQKKNNFSFGAWWTITLILILFFVGALWYLKQQAPLSYRHFAKVSSEKKIQTKPKIISSSRNTTSTLPPRFEFYDISPNHKNKDVTNAGNNRPANVVSAKFSSTQAPLQTLSVPPFSSNASVAAPPRSLNPNSNNQISLSSTSTAIFLLQIAAFKDFQEADKLKAQLSLQGFKVQVLEKIVAGVKWLRVQVGPFNSEKVAKQAQNLLSQHHYSSILLKQ